MNEVLQSLFYIRDTSEGSTGTHVDGRSTHEQTLVPFSSELLFCACVEGRVPAATTSARCSLNTPEPVPTPTTHYTTGGSAFLSVVGFYRSLPAAACRPGSVETTCVSFQRSRVLWVCSTGNASAAAQSPVAWSEPASTASWPVWMDATVLTVSPAHLSPPGLPFCHVRCDVLASPQV